MRKPWVSKRKKGNVLPITLILILGMLAMATFIGDYFDNRNFYIVNYLENMDKMSNESKHREYLMTQFNNYILENLPIIKQEGVNKYFSTKYKDNIVFESSKIIYDGGSDIFIMNMKDNIYTFKINIINDEVSYSFVK